MIWFILQQSIRNFTLQMYFPPPLRHDISFDKTNIFLIFIFNIWIWTMLKRYNQNYYWKRNQWIVVWWFLQGSIRILCTVPFHVCVLSVCVMYVVVLLKSGQYCCVLSISIGLLIIQILRIVIPWATWFLPHVCLPVRKKYFWAHESSLATLYCI